MIVLGIETTCDETSAALVENGRKILSSSIASSSKLFRKYGGVVPEVAAREQIRSIIPVLRESTAQVKPSQIDAIAVSHGPGLVGSLLIGVETAKALAIAWDKPLVLVNHLIGHVYANFVSELPNSKAEIPKFPVVALIVSGGHTDLILMTDHGKYQWLGGTLDDAAGEAFDKVARTLGLGYPGGPEIERIALKSKLASRKLLVDLPRPMLRDGSFDFSFSGLKTAVVSLINSYGDKPLTIARSADIAVSFQRAVIDVLVEKTIRAAKKYEVCEILVGGGVAANRLLRSELTGRGLQLGMKVKFPSIDLSVDNAAMIAAAAYFNFIPQEATAAQALPGLYF